MMTLEQIARQLDAIVDGINALSNEVFLVSERQKQMQLDLTFPLRDIQPIPGKQGSWPAISAEPDAWPIPPSREIPIGTIFPIRRAPPSDVAHGPTAAERRAMDQRAHALFGGSDPVER